MLPSLPINTKVKTSNLDYNELLSIQEWEGMKSALNKQSTQTLNISKSKSLINKIYSNNNRSLCDNSRLMNSKILDTESFANLYNGFLSVGLIESKDLLESIDTTSMREILISNIHSAETLIGLRAIIDKALTHDMNNNNHNNCQSYSLSAFDKKYSNWIQINTEEEWYGTKIKALENDKYIRMMLTTLTAMNNNSHNHNHSHFNSLELKQNSLFKKYKTPTEIMFDKDLANEKFDESISTVLNYRTTNMNTNSQINHNTNLISISSDYSTNEKSKQRSQLYPRTKPKPLGPNIDKLEKYALKLEDRLIQTKW